MSTLTAILDRVGNLLDPHYTTGTATGGSATTLIDTVHLLDGVRGSYYKYGYICRTALASTHADYQRRVKTDTASSGTLTLDTMGSTANGVAYQAWTVFEPLRVVAAINRALERMEFVEQIDLGPGQSILTVDGQRQYDLSSLTWLTRPQQFYRLSLRTGSTASQYQWTELLGARLTQDEDALTLDLTQQTVGSQDTVRLEATRTFDTLGTLTTGADTTKAPLDWISAETVLEVMRTPAASRVGPELQSQLDAEVARAWVTVEHYRSRYRPQLSRSLFDTPSQPWGSSGRTWW